MDDRVPHEFSPTYDNFQFWSYMYLCRSYSISKSSNFGQGANIGTLDPGAGPQMSENRQLVLYFWQLGLLSRFRFCKKRELTGYKNLGSFCQRTVAHASAETTNYCPTQEAGEGGDTGKEHAIQMTEFTLNSAQLILAWKGENAPMRVFQRILQFSHSSKST